MEEATTSIRSAPHGLRLLPPLPIPMSIGIGIHYHLPPAVGAKRSQTRIIPIIHRRGTEGAEALWGKRTQTRSIPIIGGPAAQVIGER